MRGVQVRFPHRERRGDPSIDRQVANDKRLSWSVHRAGSYQEKGQGRSVASVMHFLLLALLSSRHELV